MDKSNNSAALSSDDQRYSPRLALKGRATITATIDGKECECTLIDMSDTGAKLRFREAPAPFKDISIVHEALGLFVGECVWQSASFVGMRFKEAGPSKVAVPVHACP